MRAVFRPDELRPNSGAVALTARDRWLFAALLRHRVLGVAWLAREEFGGSVPAAWERLRRLRNAGYLEQVRTQLGAPKGYTLTALGKAELGLERRGRPRRGLPVAQVCHNMAIADVAQSLLAAFAGDPAYAAAWLTESELRDGEGADWLPKGHLPDGVLVVTARAGLGHRHDVRGAVHRMAVEVELHDKAASRYPKKLAWYRTLLERGVLHLVRWYVADGTVGGVVRRGLRGAEIADDDERVEVVLLPDGVRRSGAA